MKTTNRLNRIPAALWLAAGLLLAHCGGGHGSSTSTTTDGLMDRCGRATDKYTCSDGTVFTMDAGSGSSCFFNTTGEAHYWILRADGTAFRAGSDPFTWTGDASGFTVCDPSNHCIDCTDTTPAAGSASPSCHGSPASCPVSPPCSRIRGCTLELGADPTDSSEDSCSGPADACDTFDTQDGCEQQGCKWQ